MSGVKGITRSSLEHQLRMLPPRFGLKPDGKMALIKCPDHKSGMEQHASMRINLEGNTKHKIGSSHCFVCGAHYGSWSKLYARLTGKEAPESIIKNFQGTGSESFIKSIMAPSEDEAVSEFPSEINSIIWDRTREWRRINGELLAGINALYYINPKIDRPNLFLPCYIHGVLAGGINANIEPIGKNNYFNTAGDWTHTALFPFDYVKEMIAERRLDYVVLVEGPRDALYLLQYGIPALAIMGTGHAGLAVKYMLLDDLEIDRVVLAFDGDGAGKQAKEKAKAILKGGFRLSVVGFDEGDDPAKLSKKEVLSIKRQLEKNIRQPALL